MTLRQADRGLRSDWLRTRGYALPGGGLALLAPDRQRIVVLNRSAHFLWRVLGCAGRKTLPDALSRRFHLSPEQARRDVDAIWAGWVDAGLLAPSPIAETNGDPIRPADRPLEDASGSLLLAAGPLLIDLRFSPSLVRFFLPLWRDRVQTLGAPNLRCVIRADGVGGGSLEAGGETILDADVLQLVGRFNRLVIERLRPGRRLPAMLHAGAVARQDKAVVIAAPSGSGKSTLIGYLVAHGFDYLADDLVALEGDELAVLPFPLPISVKAGAKAVLAPYHPQLAGSGTEDLWLDWRADFAAKPCSGKLLLFPRYVPKAATQFDEVSVEDAFVRLLADRAWLGTPIEDANVRGFIAWLRAIERRTLVYSDFAEAQRCIDSVLA